MIYGRDNIEGTLQALGSEPIIFSRALHVSPPYRLIGLCNSPDFLSVPDVQFFIGSLEHDGKALRNSWASPVQLSPDESGSDDLLQECLFTVANNNRRLGCALVQRSLPRCCKRCDVRRKHDSLAFEGIQRRRGRYALPKPNVFLRSLMELGERGCSPHIEEAFLLQTQQRLVDTRLLLASELPISDD